LTEEQQKLLESLNKVDDQVFVDIGESKCSKEAKEFAKIIYED
jgi:hypothetical protein